MSIATRIQSMEEHIADAYDSLSKFGVAAPSNKNIENIASLVDEIYDNTPKTDYVSGTDLTIENTRIGKIDFKDTDNIEKIGLGATSQQTYTGKNLLHNVGTSGSSNGITWTKNSDGTIKVNGTATADVSFYISGSLTFASGSYILSGCPSGGSSSTYSMVLEGTARDVGSGKTFTSVTNKKVAIEVKNGTTCNNLIFQPQIEAGSTATSYEQYVGGVVSPNPKYPQNIYVVKDNSKIKMHNKNLLPNYRPETQTLNSVTLTNNGNGTFSLSGTASAYTQFIDTNSFFLPAGTYTLYSPNLNNKIILQLRSLDGYTTIANTGNTTSKLYDTFTLNTQTEVKARIVINASETNVEITPMIYAGNYDETTTFVLYKEQNYEIILPVENKLPYPYVDTTKTNNGITYTDLGDGRIKVNGTATANSAFSLYGTSSSQIALSANYIYGGVNSNVRVRVMNRNSSGTYTTLGNSTGSSTLINKGTYETGYVEISIANGTTVNNLIIIPMLSDKEINAYTPFGTTPIELCQIGQYQDYIYKNNGNWFIHKEIGKVVLNGSETPTINTVLTNTTRALYRNILPYNSKGGVGSSICNLLPYYENWITDVEGFYLDNNTTNLVFRINKSTVGTTITSVNNFLSENNMTIYYILETPINIEITDTTLISQLDAWYNAQSMNDITYITVDGDLPMQLKLRALKK